MKALFTDTSEVKRRNNTFNEMTLRIEGQKSKLKPHPRTFPRAFMRLRISILPFSVGKYTIFK